jgi:hypothetical protein
VVLSIFSPRSGTPADPSSDCNVDLSVSVLLAYLVDEAEYVEQMLGLNDGSVGTQQHKDLRGVLFATS